MNPDGREYEEDTRAIATRSLARSEVVLVRSEVVLVRSEVRATFYEVRECGEMKLPALQRF